MHRWSIVIISGLLLARPVAAMPNPCPSSPPSPTPQRILTVFPSLLLSTTEPGKGHGPGSGLEINPTTPTTSKSQVLLHQAEKAYKEEQFSTAESILTQFLQQDPTVSFGWERLGNVLRRQNKLAEARKAYDQAIQLDRRNISAYQGRGILGQSNASVIDLRSLEVTHRDLAILIYREFLKVNPDYEESYSRLGFALGLQEWTESKQTDLTLSDDKLDFYWTPLKKQSVNLVRLKELTELYQQAYFRFPTNQQFFDSLTDILQGQERSDEVIRLYNDKIEKDPSDIDLRIRLGKLFIRFKRIEQAQKVFCQTLRIQRQEKKNPSDSLEGIARILGPKRQTYRIIDFYKQEIKLTQVLEIRSRIRHNLAKVLSASDRLRDVVPVYQDIIQETPEDLFSYLYLGDIYGLLDRPEDQLNILKSGLKILKASRADRWPDSFRQGLEERIKQAQLKLSERRSR